MSKEMTEVNVQELSCVCFKHEIAWMTISNTQNIGCHTLTSERFHELGVEAV